MKTKLFLIRQSANGHYWTCSSEHGTGWVSVPKQAFSPSELTRNLRLLIDNEWFSTCEILELHIQEVNESPKYSDSLKAIKDIVKEIEVIDGDR